MAPLKIWYTPAKCADINEAMLAGFRRHGDVPGSHHGFDMACFWSMHKRRHIQLCKRKKKPFLLMERAYLGDRFKWVSLGWNGLNGEGNFCNQSVPDDRWRKYWADRVKPWKQGGDYALVVGQVPGDASLRGKCIYAIAEQAIAEAQRHYDRVYYRPHPLAKRNRPVRGAKELKGSLEDALAGAEVVITYNSNTAVDAVMAGIPAVALGPYSMAEAVTTRTIGEPLYRGDRDAWGARLAYCQWLPSEIESGEAWAHLRGFVSG